MTDKMHTVSKTKARARAAAWLLLAALPLSGGCGKESGGPGRGGEQVQTGEAESLPMSLGKNAEESSWDTMSYGGSLVQQDSTTASFEWGEGDKSDGSMQTKSMWNSGDDLKASDNRVEVRDYISEHKRWNGDGWSDVSVPVRYIPRNDTPEEAITSKMGESEAEWAQSGRTYFWTQYGVHQFMSWLTYDDNLKMKASEFFGELSFSEPTGTQDYSGNVISESGYEFELNVPTKTFSYDTPQFDFIYSDLVERNMSEGNYSTVDFTYHHLFTAFNIGVRNNTGYDVTITEFSITGLPDTRGNYEDNGATITFGKESTTSYGCSTVKNQTFFNMHKANVNYDKILAGGTIGDMFTNKEKDMHLMWPVDDLAKASINIEYELTDPWSEETYNRVVSKSIPFPDEKWLAGTEYSYVLVLNMRSYKWEHVGFYDRDFVEPGRGWNKKTGEDAFYPYSSYKDNYCDVGSSECRYRIRTGVTKVPFYFTYDKDKVGVVVTVTIEGGTIPTDQDNFTVEDLGNGKYKLKPKDNSKKEQSFTIDLSENYSSSVNVVISADDYYDGNADMDRALFIKKGSLDLHGEDDYGDGEEVDYGFWYYPKKGNQWNNEVWGGVITLSPGYDASSNSVPKPWAAEFSTGHSDNYPPKAYEHNDADIVIDLKDVKMSKEDLVYFYIWGESYVDEHGYQYMIDDKSEHSPQSGKGDYVGVTYLFSYATATVEALTTATSGNRVALDFDRVELLK